MYGQAPSSEKLQTGFYCWSEQREKAEVPTVSQEEAGRVCSQTPSRKKKNWEMGVLACSLCLAQGRQLWGLLMCPVFAASLFAVVLWGL